MVINKRNSLRPLFIVLFLLNPFISTTSATKAPTISSIPSAFVPARLSKLTSLSFKKIQQEQKILLNQSNTQAATTSSSKTTPTATGPLKIDREVYTQSSNGLDSFYPHLFEGRLWFRPAIVSLNSPISKSTTSTLPSQILPLSLFNYTIGGTVALEYDQSPKGYYLEYVTMGSIVGLNSLQDNEEWWKLKKQRNIGIGQWGSKLYVSTQEAVDLCQQVWGVPAICGEIKFDDSEKGLKVEAAPKGDEEDEGDRPQITLNGWKATRSYDKSSQSKEEYEKRIYLPVLWTPTIKALWFPFALPLPLFSSFSEQDEEKKTAKATTSFTDARLPVHKLRLSFKSIRLHWCPQWPSKELGVPFPIGFSVDGLRIEISDGVDNW